MTSKVIKGKRYLSRLTFLFASGAKLFLEMGNLRAVLVALSVAGLCQCLSDGTSKVQGGGGASVAASRRGASLVKRDTMSLIRFVLYFDNGPSSFAF